MSFLFVRDACYVSYRLRNELRSRGYGADALVFREQVGEALDPKWAMGPGRSWDEMRIPTLEPDSHRPDWFVPEERWRGARLLQKWFRVAGLARRYDVVVWATGPPWWAPLVHVGGPRMVAHFHGSELTSGRARVPRNAPILVSTPNLLDLVDDDRATLLPNPIERIEARDESAAHALRIGHYPSNPKTKGTKEIRAALTALQVEHPELEVDIATGLPHDEVLDRMRQCHIIIDQHNNLGAHGVVSLEAMSMGKVVLCSIRPEWYPGCPIITTIPDLDKALQTVLDLRDRWPEIGVAGRSYVAARHSQAQGANILLEALGLPLSVE